MSLNLVKKDAGHLSEQQTCSLSQMLPESIGGRERRGWNKLVSRHSWECNFLVASCVIVQFCSRAYLASIGKNDVMRCTHQTWGRSSATRNEGTNLGDVMKSRKRKREIRSRLTRKFSEGWSEASQICTNLQQSIKPSAYEREREKKNWEWKRE